MKRCSTRLTALLCCAALLFAMCPLSASAAVKGDVTGDGTVNTMDALYLYSFVAGVRSTITSAQTTAADQDGNAKVNMMDVLMLFKTVSGRDPSTAKPQNGAAVRAGVTPESTYMKNIKVVNNYTGKSFSGATKSGLQMAVAEIVRYEMGMSTFAEKSTEAWKAQAVAAYTMLARYCYNGSAYPISMSKDIDLNNDNDKRIYNAVGEVLGIKIAYNDSSRSAYNQLCEVFYSAGSAGVSCSTLTVWGYTDYEYLQPVESIYDNANWVAYCSAGIDSFKRSFTIPFSELKNCVKKWIGKEIYHDTTAGKRSLYPTKTDGPYWAYSNLWYYNSSNKKTYVSGNDICQAICVYHPDIYCASHALNVVAESGGNLTIETKGHGHGIGLSQYGAAGYANKAGWTYDQILAHYFCIKDTTAWGLVGPKW